jgi:hypothetical protein
MNKFVNLNPPAALILVSLLLLAAGCDRRQDSPLASTERTATAAAARQLSPHDVLVQEAIGVATARFATNWLQFHDSCFLYVKDGDFRYVVQQRGPITHFGKESPLNEADGLNGITIRVIVGFDSKAFRIWRSEKNLGKWSDWEISEYGYDKYYNKTWHPTFVKYEVINVKGKWYIEESLGQSKGKGIYDADALRWFRTNVRRMAFTCDQIPGDDATSDNLP